MIAVLFARGDSCYKAMAGADVWDIDRDARRWPGGHPVVAHPPCRAWGRLRQFAKPRHDEKELALWAVDQIRTHGGVLEHPECSSLWPAAGLPRPSEPADRWGGWTLPIVQSWWGHRAAKATWLYIVGCRPVDIPQMPLVLGRPSHVVSHRTGFTKDMPGWRPRIDKAEREHTPPELAAWLLELAGRCRAPKGALQ